MRVSALVASVNNFHQRLCACITVSHKASRTDLPQDSGKEQDYCSQTLREGTLLAYPVPYTNCRLQLPGPARRSWMHATYDESLTASP